MATKRNSDIPPTEPIAVSANGSDREARLAAALRQNLRRRKAQSNARAGKASDGTEQKSGPKDE